MLTTVPSPTYYRHKNTRTRRCPVSRRDAASIHRINNTRTKNLKRPHRFLVEWRTLPMSTRLSVNINDETAKALKELADERGTSITDIVRRAVAVYKFVEDETATGKKLQLVDDENHVERLAVL